MKILKKIDFGNSHYKFGLCPKTLPNRSTEFPKKINQNQSFFSRNKKGDIPVTILVIGVFAICSLALLTFFISDFKITNSFVSFEVMEKMNSQIDEYRYYRAEGVSEKKIQGYYRILEENGRSYLYLEKYSSGLLGKEQVLLFSVRYPVPNAG